MVISLVRGSETTPEESNIGSKQTTPHPYRPLRIPRQVSVEIQGGHSGAVKIMWAEMLPVCNPAGVEEG